MKVFESHWVRHPRVWWVIFVLGWTIAISMWISHRDPLTIIPEFSQAGDVVAGESLRIDLPVARNLSWRCSVNTTRTLIDSTHAEETLISDQTTTYESVKLRESETPGRLVLLVRIPVKTLAGKSMVRTNNSYRCLWNPSTWLLPIEDTWTVAMNVLPPAPTIIIKEAP